jgi:branched-subunit amino acid transport protein
MSYLVLLLSLSAVTYFTRIAMIALIGNAALSPVVLRALKLTIPAVFCAIVSMGIFAPTQTIDLFSPRVPAALVAAVVAVRSRSMGWTIGAGMLTYWAARWLEGASRG